MFRRVWNRMQLLVQWAIRINLLNIAVVQIFPYVTDWAQINGFRFKTIYKYVWSHSSTCCLRIPDVILLDPGFLHTPFGHNFFNVCWMMLSEVDVFPGLDIICNYS